MSLRRLLFLLLLTLPLISCRRGIGGGEDPGTGARWFSLDSNAVVLISPFDGSRDTIPTGRPVRSLVCMSTSYVGYLSAIGAEDAVTGVSGLSYVSNPSVRERAVEVGYDAAPDYEGILSLRPDLVVAYTVSAAEPRFLGVLRSLGVRVALVNDHLESHPLARAEYIRLFGALTGRRPMADSVYAAVCKAYENLRVAGGPRKKVLVNIPYGDQWFIPGGGNYMTRLIGDAGGLVLGAQPGESESSVISVEKAYSLAQEADVWLHPGWCKSRTDLLSAHPLFSGFPIDRMLIYNNNRRQAPGGGNDFWESGAARPDLLLKDLVRVFRGEDTDSLTYYLKLE